MERTTYDRFLEAFLLNPGFSSLLYQVLLQLCNTVFQVDNLKHTDNGKTHNRVQAAKVREFKYIINNTNKIKNCCSAIFLALGVGASPGWRMGEPFLRGGAPDNTEEGAADQNYPG